MMFNLVHREYTLVTKYKPKDNDKQRWSLFEMIVLVRQPCLDLLVKPAAWLHFCVSRSACLALRPFRAARLAAETVTCSDRRSHLRSSAAAGTGRKTRPRPKLECRKSFNLLARFFWLTRNFNAGWKILASKKSGTDKKWSPLSGAPRGKSHAISCFGWFWNSFHFPRGTILYDKLKQSFNHCY